MTRVLGFGAFLVVWGNVVSSLLGPAATLPGGNLAFAAAGVALTVISLAAARADGQGLGALIGSPRDVFLGGAAGALGAALVALGALLLLRGVAPVITGLPIEYAPLERVSGSDLALHVGLLLSLGVVIPEEVAFRGTLIALALRRAGARMALLASASAFALWHGTVIAVTVGDTTLARSPWFLPACLIALVVVFAGGLLFAALRMRTRTLATTVMAHWTFNAVLLVGLWSTRAVAHPVP